MTFDAKDERDVLASARLLGLEEACRDELTSLTEELTEILAESSVQSVRDLGDDGPAVEFRPAR